MLDARVKEIFRLQLHVLADYLLVLEKETLVGVEDSVCITLDQIFISIMNCTAVNSGRVYCMKKN